MMKSLSALSFKVHKKNNLETLGSMGEPLASDVAKWFNKSFGDNLPIINTYFQTETGVLYVHQHSKIILKKNMEL